VDAGLHFLDGDRFQRLDDPNRLASERVQARVQVGRDLDQAPFESSNPGASAPWISARAS